MIHKRQRILHKDMHLLPILCRRTRLDRNNNPKRFHNDLLFEWETWCANRNISPICFFRKPLDAYLFKNLFVTVPASVVTRTK